MFWSGRPALVTGGASFLGSHLVDSLVDRGAQVRVVDDLSSGRFENIKEHVRSGTVELIHADLREPAVARRALDEISVVFHLAADHGGRGYLDHNQAGPASNLFLDGLVFWEARRAGVDKVVFASSGCVYPNHLQMDPDCELYLTEDLVTVPYDADNMYGWAKLMGELTLKTYYAEHGLRAVSCRYFTAYGPRGLESHGIIALIARAFIKQDPFEVWGDGTQVRNWTYIDDIVRGTILAAEKIDDATAINIGTSDRTRVGDAARMILEYTGHRASMHFCPEMPTGPLNRVADNSLARELLGWEPDVPFDEGLRRTIEWYYGAKNRGETKRALDRALIGR
jgi:nucleoside-diphosphate-sugar epimerase